MSHTRIEKVNAEIAKLQANLADYATKTAKATAKLRDLEKYKITIENEEIIALFRREKFSEDEFAALLRSQRNAENIGGTEVLAEEPHEESPEEPEIEKEENLNNEE